MNDKRNRHGALGKSSSEQRICKSAAITFILCEISKALHLAEPGLTAGRLAGRLADEIKVNFEILKISCRLKYSSFASFKQGTASLQLNQCIPVGFSDKTYCKVDF